MAIKKRIFCDTNFLLDIIDTKRKYHGDAIALLWYSVDNPEIIELITSITSFKDAHYILTKLYRSDEQARESIASIMNVFVKPVDMLAEFGAAALASEEPDFEDALIATCALHEDAAVIISRDAKAFAHCSIPKLTAADFLKSENFDYNEIDL